MIAETTVDFAASRAAAHGLPSANVGVVDRSPRIRFNEGLNSRNIMMPGVAAVIEGLIGAQLMSLTISRGGNAAPLSNCFLLR